MQFTTHDAALLLCATSLPFGVARLGARWSIRLCMSSGCRARYTALSTSNERARAGCFCARARHFSSSIKYVHGASSSCVMYLCIFLTTEVRTEISKSRTRVRTALFRSARCVQAHKL
eukprot:2103947-Prymnesium_polylepis.2